MANARKAIAAALTGIVAWSAEVVVSTPSAPTAAEWVGLAGVLVTAFLVWLVPNSPPTSP